MKLQNAKAPWAAALLSALIIGLGQVYNGQWGRGIGAFLLAWLFALLIGAGIGLVLLPLWWLVVVADAWMQASRLARCPNCLSMVDRRAAVCSHCGRGLLAA